jgi:hypothetical protein
MGGGGGGMGGSRMSGIGSDSSYDPSRGGYGGGLPAAVDVDSLVTGFSSAISSLGALTRNVGSKLNDESTQRKLQDFSGSLRTTGSSLWSSFSAAASDVAYSISQPDDAGNGLAEFHREMHSHVPSQSKYGGFGSDSMIGGGMSSTQSTITEAQGLPGEDRNGIERLTGESDEQYVMRQTRLRDEAKARMAAKFGNGGGMSSASSASYGGGLGGSSHHSTSSNRSGMGAAAPSSGNAANRTPPRSAPTSGSFNSSPVRSMNNTPNRPKVESSQDFFASFGT